MFSGLSMPAISLPPTTAVSVLSTSLPLLIFSESKSFYPGSVIFKIICSAAFVAGPLLTEPTQWQPYHFLMTSGLLLSSFGDILLIPSRDEYFMLYSIPEDSINSPKTIKSPNRGEASLSIKLGMFSFAGAHGAYILAFIWNAEQISWGLFAGIFLATITIATFLGVLFPSNGSSWSNVLNLSISGEMRYLVSIYAVIISCMLAVSASANSSISTQSPYQPFIGALSFVISDIFVAKDMFGDKPNMACLRRYMGRGRYGWQRRVMGWVLYFWGQMILAGTIKA